MLTKVLSIANIGMAVASPTGDVKIIAPIPGTARIAIIVPLEKFYYPNLLGKTEKYKIIRTERIVYRGLFSQLKTFIIGLLKIIPRSLDRFIEFLEEH